MTFGVTSWAIEGGTRGIGMSRVKMGRLPRAADETAPEPMERTVRKTLAPVLAQAAVHSRQMQAVLTS
jgi:hypothetical protein